MPEPGIGPREKTVCPSPSRQHEEADRQEFLITSGWNLFVAGRYRMAARCFQVAATDQETSAEAVLYLGIALTYAGKAAAARIALERAVALDPAIATIASHFASEDASSGELAGDNWDEALTRLLSPQEAGARETVDPEHCALVTRFVAGVLYRHQQHQVAVELWERLVWARRGIPDALYLIALLRQRGEHEKAYDLCIAVRHWAPENRTTYRLLIDSALRRKAFVAAAYWVGILLTRPSLLVHKGAAEPSSSQLSVAVSWRGTSARHGVTG